MKSTAKRVLRSFIRRLPWGARESIFDELCLRMGEGEAFRRLAARMKITGISANGDYGLIQSAWNDLAILPSYAQTGRWAARTVEFFEEFFTADGGTYIDIGANIGLTTIPIARNHNVSCWAFEPEPVNFNNLANNVLLNCSLKNVTISQIALMDKPGEISLGIADDGNLGDHRVSTGLSGRRVVHVTASTLDELNLPLIGPVGIKIDTQGAEPFVLGGGQKTLAAAGAVVVEFSPAHMAEVGGDVQTVIDYLCSFAHVAIATEGTTSPLAWTEGAELRGYLSKFYVQNRGRIDQYVDVFARR